MEEGSVFAIWECVPGLLGHACAHYYKVGEVGSAIAVGPCSEPVFLSTVTQMQRRRLPGNSLCDSFPSRG